MNIGIVTTWFERGAAYVSKLYMDALSENNNVFIYARGGESYAIGNPDWDGENVYWSKKITSIFGGTLLHKKEFYNWVKKNNIKIVLFNEQTWWLPLIWCHDLNIRTVAYVDYYTESTIPLFAAYDAVICNTKKHFEAFQWHQNAIYIPWGTDVNTFRPKTIELVKGETLRFFHSCGISPRRKGTDLLIRSLEFIKNKNYKVIIHAQKDLKVLLPELAGIIENYIFDGRLCIITETVPAPGLYYLGDVYVYPSRLEGIGLTVPEAISSGLGLIVPNCGPMNEFAGDDFSKVVPVLRYFSRYDGYYWPQNEVDPQLLANTMEYFISNKENISSVKQSAREYALNYLSWNKNSHSINSVFNNVFLSTKGKFEENVKCSILMYESSGLRRFNKFYLKATWIYIIYK
jgi:glycosyltransferase involved in cell wall biosynthesis